MGLGTGRALLAVLLAAAVTACGPQSGLNESQGTGSSAAALQHGKKPNEPFAFASRTNMPHGIAGDENLVFVAEPMAQRVAVLDRDTGDEIGSLPAPAGGFQLPFALRTPRTGRLVVLDAGGFPNPAVPAVPKVYDYDYSWDDRTGSFSASIARTVDFSGLPLIYAEDIEVTSQGFYVVAESVIGALWVIDQNGAISPGIFPDNPFAPLPQLGPCFFPDTQVGDIPFHPAGNFGPGVGFLAEKDGDLYFSGVCPGGLQKVPLATLRDTTRSPGARAADISVVSPKPGADVDGFDGLAVNRWDRKDPYIYASDSFHERVIRIHSVTGQREVVAADPELFDFPVNLQFLPPKHGNQPNPLIVTSDQEQRWTALNGALSQDLFRVPFTITAVYPR